MYSNDAERNQLICKYADQCFDRWLALGKNRKHWSESERNRVVQYAKQWTTQELRGLVI